MIVYVRMYGQVLPTRRGASRAGTSLRESNLHVLDDFIGWLSGDPRRERNRDQRDYSGRDNRYPNLHHELLLMIRMLVRLAIS